MECPFKEMQSCYWEHDFEFNHDTEISNASFVALDLAIIFRVLGVIWYDSWHGKPRKDNELKNETSHPN